MSQTITTQDRTVAVRPTPPRGKYPTPPGHRVLHLVIDQETFDLLHLCALRSRMKYTAFMHRFLKEAFPYSAPEGGAGLTAAPDPGAPEGRPIPPTPSPTEP